MAEMAQMALEGGARWIILSLPDDCAGLREELVQIAELCREAGIILTATRLYVVKDLGLHGMFVDEAAINPVAVRDELGAEAIIGTFVGTPDAACAMARADIDYVVLRPDVPDEAARVMIADIANAGVKIPVVTYRPDMKPDADLVRAILAAGYAGICAGPALFEMENPVAAIEDILAASRAS